MNQTTQAIEGGGEIIRALPWLILLCAALPPIFLARWKQIYPHRPLLIACGAACLPACVVLIKPDLFLFVIVLDLVVVLIAIFDLLSLPRRSSFSVKRGTMRVASLNEPHQVQLVVDNHSARSWVVCLRDDLPQELEVTREESYLELTGRQRATVEYEFYPRRRGKFALECVHFRVRSLLGFWRRYFERAAESVIHVYPDMKQLSKYAVLARTDRLSLIGVRRTRKIGQDNEFERLRDYTLDDNYKHLDWRATARRNKLTVKDFQTNQSQRLIFMVDCGRMMTNQAVGNSLLDHSLNAMLMLSYVALRQGDSVGLICFSDRIHNFVPPRSGMRQMSQLLHASFDRFPRLVESRFDQAFLHLTTHCRKRSLVILMSNIIDEVNSHQLEQYLGNAVGRHLPLGVLIRDHRLFEAVAEERPAGKALFRAAAAAEILTWRQQVLTDLTHKGVLALDVFPEEMTAPLVNQYLDIKARHLL